MPALEYQPGDKVYLDTSNISTTRPSKKLSHRWLGPFPVEQKVGNGAYRLHLPAAMKRVHPVFNVVKLTLALEDPIVGRHAPPPPLLEIVDGEEEWVVKEILDSKVINRKLCYLVKWKDFGVEHNSWEPWDNVHAPDLVADFYRRHPGVARHIQAVDFSSLRFQYIPASGRHRPEGWVDVMGHWFSGQPTSPSIVQTPLYIPPHRRWNAWFGLRVKLNMYVIKGLFNLILTHNANILSSTILFVQGRVSWKV